MLVKDKASGRKAGLSPPPPPLRLNLSAAAFSRGEASKVQECDVSLVWGTDNDLISAFIHY